MGMRRTPIRPSAAPPMGSKDTSASTDAVMAENT